ncbi:MAG: hypothetical protein WKF83_10420 [Nocardioidaceae bacterium]
MLPISAGNVTYFKPGTVSPYVQGNIQHDGSGLSLSAGGTEVELTDFEIDPGTSKLYGNVAVNNEPAVDHAFLFQLDEEHAQAGPARRHRHDHHQHQVGRSWRRCQQPTRCTLQSSRCWLVPTCPRRP